MEALEDLGVVTSANHVGKREIVATEVPKSLQLVAAVARVADSGRPPMKPDPEFDQMKDNAYRVTAQELRAFIERFERLEAEKKDIADHQKEVMAEAKMRGYDTKAIRKLVALRKRDKDDIAEEEAVLDMYKAALGM